MHVHTCERQKIKRKNIMNYRLDITVWKTQQDLPYLKIWEFEVILSWHFLRILSPTSEN